jgi:SulP family sulfate permease
MAWWPLVTRATLKDDAMAGLTGAMIMLPQGVAFATIAGLPPEYGLYAAMMPAVVAALFGSSWHLVSGPTTAISIALFAALHNLAEPGSAEYIRLALTLTFLVGLYQCRATRGNQINRRRRIPARVVAGDGFAQCHNAHRNGFP